MLAERELCCGCRACKEICKRDAITMVEDGLGFVYPKIDNSKCIQCRRCVNVCPILNSASSKNEIEIATAAIHRNSDVVRESSSGGAFTAVFEAWKLLAPDTYIAGAVWKDDFSVEHRLVDSESGIDMFHKSKYIMSDTNGVYEKTKKLLNAGKPVLFSGTPCQVAALENYLGKPYEKLLTVDLVCHGAPSAKMFQWHIDELSKKCGQKVVSYQFRNKEPIGGKVNGRSAMIVFQDGTSQLFLDNEDSYMKAYYARLGYRPSCKKCIYAKPERCSDITICDAHHIEKKYPEIYCMQGVSCVLYHSKKALLLKEKIEEQMILYPVTKEWIVEYNEQMRHPTFSHPNDEKFKSLLLDGEAFSVSVNTALHKSVGDKIKGRLKKIWC